jgi:transposase InsO family protein
LVERDFRPTDPNQTWSADITYVSTWEGFLYLAHVQDLFSRRIVGWSIEPSWGCWRLLALETRTELCRQIMELEGQRAGATRMRRSGLR